MSFAPVSVHNKQVGAGGEQHAADFLVSQGYRLIDTNVRPLGGMARGEIDVLAWHGDMLCFVEVKSRRSRLQGTPAEAITPAKQRQLVRLAEAYLAKHDLHDVPCRFDVVEVVWDQAGRVHCSLLVGAFDGS